MHAVRAKETKGLAVNGTRFISDLLATVFERSAPWRGGRDGRPIDELCRELLTSRGEVTGTRLAGIILDRYTTLDEESRLGFFGFLAEELDLDPEMLALAVDAYSAERSAANLDRLVSAAEPARRELLRRLNSVMGATERLVAMRSDLLVAIRNRPELARADADFEYLFGSWFNQGFLVLRRIDWQTPASILEKIIAYEAVHEIQSWDDLRRRIQPPDRRCFAFFHPSMPNDPLIFVQVALADGIPGSIQDILAPEREAIEPHEAQTAVFYSITNCQKGLRGISFGNSLIKLVARDLAIELPQLKTFVTLSPMPIFRRWLASAEASDLANAAGAVTDATDHAGQTGQHEPLVAEAATVQRLAARYLLDERRDDGQPIDPVARFHLNNGASVHAVHAMADVSANGLKQSCGAMVNYLYDLDRVEQNHEAFAAKQKVVASRVVQSLAKAGLGRRDTKQALAG